MEQYMRRCFDLARLGAGRVSPNPMVGAVLVHQDRIIGEGYHAAYGKPHAEVNAIESVAPEDRHLIPDATLFVSLEPCCIFGRTPPCTDRIRAEGIGRVVISVLDATPEVAGRGVEILQNSGVEVVTGVLETEGLFLARMRDTLVRFRRPYLLLKAAVSADGYMGLPDKQAMLSDPASARLVHKCRAEYAAILVGTNTALIDDPALTLRHYPGNNPLRITIDRRGRLPLNLRLFTDEQPTWILTANPEYYSNLSPQKSIIPIPAKGNYWPHLFDRLVTAGKNSLLVEGGSSIFRDLLEKDLWDEIRILRTSKQLGNNGIPLPDPMLRISSVEQPLVSDRLQVILHPRFDR